MDVVGQDHQILTAAVETDTLVQGHRPGSVMGVEVAMTIGLDVRRRLVDIGETDPLISTMDVEEVDLDPRMGAGPSIVMADATT
jgi:hypothetical protein